jgi:hypothetical protein
MNVGDKVYAVGYNKVLCRSILKISSKDEVNKIFRHTNNTTLGDIIEYHYLIKDDSSPEEVDKLKKKLYEYQFDEHYLQMMFISAGVIGVHKDGRICSIKNRYGMAYEAYKEEINYLIKLAIASLLKGTKSFYVKEINDGDYNEFARYFTNAKCETIEVHSKDK